MFRNILFVLLVAVLLVPAMLPAPAQAVTIEDVDVWILPWTSDLTWEVPEGETVYLGIAWAVCRAPGLIEGHQNNYYYEALTLDGVSLLGNTVQDAKPYWQPTEHVAEGIDICNNHPDDIYVSLWAFPIDGLEPGTYDLSALPHTIHPETDLYDGALVGEDGKPIIYAPGLNFEWHGTLVIQ